MFHYTVRVQAINLDGDRRTFTYKVKAASVSDAKYEAERKVRHRAGDWDPVDSSVDARATAANAPGRIRQTSEARKAKDIAKKYGRR